MKKQSLKPLFVVKDVDRRFYEKNIAGWLPNKIIDAHTHVWLKQFNKQDLVKTKRTVAWPSLVAAENPIEHLLQTYDLILPAHDVTPMIFASLTKDYLDAANDYVAQAAHTAQVPALIFSDPQWSAQDLERRIKRGNFLGIKSYLTMAPSYLPVKEIRIFDFFPHHQLELMNRYGWIVMLHIPRDERLRDPVNLAQLLEIEERYPKLQLIVAHVGRAYCPEDVGDAFKVLAATKRMCFDFSANTNAAIFRQLLETVGPKRVLFGSDLPILRMRARRVCEKGFYINLVPKGLYGNISIDPHIRELTGTAAEKLTFFIYEELAAFGRTARAIGLSDADLRDVFYNNAARMLRRARRGMSLSI